MVTLRTSLQCVHGYNACMVTMLLSLQCYHAGIVTMRTMLTMLTWLILFKLPNLFTNFNRDVLTIQETCLHHNYAVITVWR